MDKTMPNNELPNLSTWHRIPTGAVIPKNTPYAYVYNGGLMVELDGYYTEHPILPPLPTEEGATIMASGDERLPPHILLTHQDGRRVNHLGMECPAERITAWAPVTIGEVVVMP